ncbi:DUF3667 domain-containing protein [Xanthovirga aplysinae]|uniref:DUF3667 domain-containing protein n=1 Tax=Xanthovirga aplysinae TaxID=2529853 RepID=UPI0016571FD3|nr:DUF3667 domain-containing protein [Xanthovirga aplysinae]
MGRSIFPFFFKPGFLTNRFNEGQRVAYVHPLRLYFILSIFFFFALKITWNNEVQKATEEIGNKLNQEEVIEEVILGIFGVGEKENNSEKENGVAELSTKVDTLKAEWKNALLENDPLNNFEIGGKESRRQREEKGTAFSIETDSSKEAEKDVDRANNFTLIRVNEKQLSIGPNSTYRALRGEWRNLTDEQVLDSLNWTFTSSFERSMWKVGLHQFRKLVENDINFFINYMFSNLSLMMILIVPIFALLLKLLYIRRKFVYVDHVIHSIHIHAFAYLIYGIFFLIQLWVPFSSSLVWVFLILVTLYCFMSFKRVYKQGYRKTIFKFLSMGWFYFFIIIFAGTLELFLSLIFY